MAPKARTMCWFGSQLALHLPFELVPVIPPPPPITEAPYAVESVDWNKFVGTIVNIIANARNADIHL